MACKQMSQQLLSYVFAVGLLLALALVVTVYADNGPHGGYTPTTDACAGCHRAHTARAARLLIDDVPALCFTCHGNTGTGADTNVLDGVYLERDFEIEVPVEGTHNRGLRAGGFQSALMDTDALTTTTSVISPTTSSHLADGSLGTAWGNGLISPILNPGATGFSLSCVSCHDPHGAGTYRILRPIPTGFAGGTSPTTTVTITDTGTVSYTVADAFNTYIGEPYGTLGSPLASWCSQCHTRYLAPSGSGHVDSGDAIFQYRHTTTSVSCVECHVAHGTSATMGLYSGSVLWPDTANTPNGDARSSLLRLDNRGVCAYCHVDDEGNVTGGACTACHNVPRGNRQAVNPNAFAMSSHQGTDCLGCHVEMTTHRDGILQMGTAGNPIVAETPSGDLQVDQFCYQCHTQGMVQNDALSNNRPGGFVSADDIEEAFSKSEKHDLGTAFTIGSDTFTIQCTTCHNPHVVTGKYWDAESGVSPVTRPDFSDAVYNPRATGATLWGDEPGEKMADFAAQGSGSGGWYYSVARGGVISFDQPAAYQPPKSGSGYDFEFGGELLPDYTTLCLDCHTYRMSAANPPINWGQGISCTDNSVDPPNQRVECGAQPDLWSCVAVGQPASRGHRFGYASGSSGPGG